MFTNLEEDISLLYMHPLITEANFRSAFMREKGVNEITPKYCKECKCSWDKKNYVYSKAVIIQAYGMGNFPMETKGLKEIVFTALKAGTIVVIVSQCRNGFTNSVYSSSVELKKAGAILAEDMTLEATIAKLSYLLGNGITESEKLRKEFLKDTKGEISSDSQSSLKLYNFVSKIVLDSKHKTVNHIIGKSNNDGNSSFKVPSLHKAVLDNDVTKVHEILNKDPETWNKVDKNGNSALFYACLAKNSTIARILNFEGGEVKSSKKNLAKSLLELITNEDKASLKLFYKAGLNFKNYFKDQNVMKKLSTLLNTKLR